MNLNALELAAECGCPRCSKAALRMIAAIDKTVIVTAETPDALEVVRAVEAQGNGRSRRLPCW